MSPAVQGSFTRVSSGTHGCKQLCGFYVGIDTICPMSRQVLGGARSVSGPTTAVQAHRGSPDRATGVLENTLEALSLIHI